MTPLKLQFRAKLPDGTYFEQGNQYIISFMRRAASFAKFGGPDFGDTHEKYLEKPLEDYLEILIDGEWRSCAFETPNLISKREGV